MSNQINDLLAQISNFKNNIANSNDLMEHLQSTEEELKASAKKTDEFYLNIKSVEHKVDVINNDLHELIRLTNIVFSSVEDRIIKILKLYRWILLGISIISIVNLVILILK